MNAHAPAPSLAAAATAPTLRIAGYPIVRHSAATLLTEIEQRMADGRQTLLFFANTNFVVQCRALRTALCSPDVLIVNDGVGVDIAARLTYGQRFLENLNGTDFVPLLMRSSARPLRVFLYGGTATAVAGAATALAAMGQTICGHLDGYQPDLQQVRHAIEAAAADVVLVAMGNPLQERWILQNADTLSPQLFIGVGALFDFLSGKARRAPQWVRRLRLEWFYRLCREPRRLGRRYTFDVLIFLKLCLRARGRRKQAH